MADNMYISSFGVPRYVGRGEGVDNLNNAGAPQSFGPLSYVEVPVDGDNDQPTENADDMFARGVAKVPAGSFVYYAALLTTAAGSAAGVNVGLYQKDGTAIDADGLIAAASPATGTITEGAGALIGKVVSEDGYIKATGTLTGLKGKLVVFYF